MSDLTGTEKRTAAQHLASVWGDGKRRVVVARRTSFRVGVQTITKDPTQVIDDPHTIALLEEHGVEFIDLEVNGRPKRGKGLIDAENAVNANIDAVAEALSIAPALLHDAIEKGGVERIEAVLAAVKAVADAAAEKAWSEAVDHKEDPENLTPRSEGAPPSDDALLGTPDLDTHGA